VTAFLIVGIYLMVVFYNGKQCDLSNKLSSGYCGDKWKVVFSAGNLYNKGSFDSVGVGLHGASFAILLVVNIIYLALIIRVDDEID
jgi:hypothetical protein